MKAWIIADKYEGYSTIVFHDHSVAARRIGADDLGADFEGVSCSRCPQLDKYAKTAVPIEVLINDFGWWHECHNCYKIVDESNSAEAVFRNNSTIFCSAQCEKSMHERIDRINAEYEQFQIAILNLGFKETIVGFDGGYPCLTPVAYWNFPGAEYLGTIRINRKMKKLTMYCCGGDFGAYKKWKYG